MPKGGPDGGDGGRGGDVLLRVRRLAARPAGLPPPRALPRGARRPRPGRAAPRRRRRAAGRRRAARHAGRALGRHALRPRARPARRSTLARGGAGGRGNKRFTTADPPGAAAGRARASPGRRASVELHLKLLADVGLVGLPNAGKSSLLARLTRAQPKVAGYPFTTLEPVLGTLEADDRQLVIADIPGLIEGASGGAGLGHDFLAHVERTRLLVHVLDLAPLDGSDPVANHARDRARAGRARPAAGRAAAHPRALQGRPRDAGGGRGRGGRRRGAERARRRRPGARHLERDRARASTSSSASCCAACRSPSPSPVDGRRGRAGRVPRLPPGRGPRRSRSSGSAPARSASPASAVDRLIARHDLENEEALAHVEQRLRRLGVIARARGRGLRARRRRRDRRRRVRARPGLAALAASPWPQLSSPADLDRHDGAGAPGRLPPDHRAPARRRPRGRGHRARLRADAPAARAASGSTHTAVGRHGGASRAAQARGAGRPDAADAPLRAAGASTSRSRTAPTTSRSPPRRCASRPSTRSTTSSPIQQHNIGCRLARRVMTPDAIPPERLERYGVGAGQARPVPRAQGGVLPRRTSSPTTACSSELGVDRERVLVIVRPPPDVSLYHRKSNRLFPRVLDAPRPPRGRPRASWSRARRPQREYVRARGCRR